MAMERFRASPLPNPPPEYDPQYLRQLIRVIEIYFSQLDSLTPNHAQSYRANILYGALVARNVTTAEKDALDAVVGMVVFDTDLDKLCVYTLSTGWEAITSAVIVEANVTLTGVGASASVGTSTVSTP
jgi:hypothetical protein